MIAATMIAAPTIATVTLEEPRRSEADREAYEPVKQILEAWAAYAPTPIPSCPYGLAGKRDEVADTLRASRHSATIDSRAHDTARMYSDWLLSVTDAESENAGKLLALVFAIEVIGKLCVRYPTSKSLAANLYKFTKRLGAEYNVEKWPRTRAKQMEWVKKAVVNLKAMPAEWRLVVHVGGC
jgi:hypothetical protein